MGLVLAKHGEVARHRPEEITYYRLFGADFSTPTAAITEAYTRIMDALHSRHSGGDLEDVAQTITFVNHAYETVTQNRTAYDAAVRLKQLCS